MRLLCELGRASACLVSHVECTRRLLHRPAWVGWQHDLDDELGSSIPAWGLPQIPSQHRIQPAPNHVGARQWRGRTSHNSDDLWLESAWVDPK